MARYCAIGMLALLACGGDKGGDESDASTDTGVDGGSVDDTGDASPGDSCETEQKSSCAGHYSDKWQHPFEFAHGTEYCMQGGAVYRCDDGVWSEVGTCLVAEETAHCADDASNFYQEGEVCFGSWGLYRCPQGGGELEFVNGRCDRPDLELVQPMADTWAVTRDEDPSNDNHLFADGWAGCFANGKFWGKYGESWQERVSCALEPANENGCESEGTFFPIGRDVCFDDVGLWRCKSDKSWTRSDPDHPGCYSSAGPTCATPPAHQTVAIALGESTPFQLCGDERRTFYIELDVDSMVSIETEYLAVGWSPTQSLVERGSEDCPVAVPIRDNGYNIVLTAGQYELTVTATSQGAYGRVRVDTSDIF